MLNNNCYQPIQHITIKDYESQWVSLAVITKDEYKQKATVAFLQVVS